MRKIVSYLLLAIPIAALLGLAFVGNSCANTTTPPSGGLKDTIPPFITNIRPLPGTTRVPVHGTQISISFDEYVKVKDPKGIFLSPPLEKSPKYKMRGKSLVISFESDLQENTTYTLDLTGAIVDNNEGNPFPGYTLVFSTGEQIDTMVVTGVVRDCNTLQPVKGATVMLYKDLADSAVFLKRPDAAMKTDDWGFFALRNIGTGPYRLYAMRDAAADNLYDSENDLIAFVDSVIVPKIVALDTLPELLKYDMKDTLHCMARKEEYEMLLFREKPSRQMIRNRMRTGDRSAYVTFMAPNAAVDSLWIGGFPGNRVITQFNIQRDSMEIWVNDRRRMPDTLHVFVDYLKTDSLGLPKPSVEHLRLAMEKKSKTASKSARRNLKHEDTTCVLNVLAPPETVEQYGFIFEFKQPIIYEMFDSVSLIGVNPRQQEERMEFSVTRDSLNLRKYTLMPKAKLQAGYEYKLKVPWRGFRDINGFYSDSTEMKVSLPKDDKLSSITLDLTGVNNRYIVDLLNEKRDKVLRQYLIESDGTLEFPYLKEGKYSIRITEDKNKNGMVDTGSLLGHRQPEKVKFYRLRDGSYVIQVPVGTQMQQHIDVAQLFRQ